MRVLLGFHWRGEPYESLMRDKIISEYREMYPWSEVRRSDSNHQPYNRAASRNVLAAVALEDGFDVVVIADADGIPDEQPLKDAIEQAYQDGKCHVPFNRVRVIGSKHAYSKGQAYTRARPIYTYGPSCGGIFVIRPERWVFSGGMDERIVGWGYEDQIFLVAIRTFLGDPVYHTGNLYNFNHPRVTSSVHDGANGTLRDSYNQNVGNRPKIRLLQLGSNRWTGLNE